MRLRTTSRGALNLTPDPGVTVPVVGEVNKPTAVQSVHLTFTGYLVEDLDLDHDIIFILHENCSDVDPVSGSGTSQNNCMIYGTYLSLPKTYS